MVTRKRNKSFLTIMRIVMLFIVGMVVAFVIALSQVNLETLRGNILSILQNATGMPVEIDGAVSWKFSLRPRIELNQVRVPNADWAKHKYAFSAEKIDVTLNLFSLFQSRPTIQNIKVYDATVCLEKNADGAYSIVSALADNTASDDGTKTVQSKYPFTDPGLGGVEVRNLVAHIFDESYSLSGFQLRYVPKSDSREYAGWIKNGDDVFPFIITYSEYNAERRVYPMRIAFSSGGNALIANIALEGQSRMPIDFIIKGDIPDIRAVGRLLKLDLHKVPKMQVNIAGGLDHSKLTLRKSSIVVAGNELTISGAFDWSRATPQLNANVESKSLNLIQIFPDVYDGNWTHPDRELNAFHDIPLFGHEIGGFNGTVRAKIGKLIVYRDLTIGQIDLTAKVQNRVVRIDMGATIGGGNIQIGADGDIDADGRIFATVAATGRDILIGQILNEVWESDFISGLPTNIDLYIQGNGTNLSEMMSTITGPVQIKSSGTGYAHSALMSYMYGTDFLTSVRHAIEDSLRSEKKYNGFTIKCVALNTKLRDGVAETQNGVAVETNVINLRLAGNLNLGGENMKIALTTVPVRGLKLSLTGNVVNSIEISGNLSEPDVRISGAAVAGKVASATGLGLLLAPFTGGIGLVAGAGVGLLAGDLLENWLADDHPCETAMERGAPDMRNDPEWMNLPIPELQQTIMSKQTQGEK